jgi:bis(5'-nucleosidyl)-tetraphosphatase
MPGILTIFDFDDTLISSETEVIVNHSDGRISYLDSEEYAKYNPLPEDKFDFSNFDMYPKSPKRVHHTFDELDSAISRGDTVIILTARGSSTPVNEFMLDHGYGIEVVAVGSSDPRAKARVVLDMIKDGDFDLVQVFEDNATNIRAIKKVVTDTGVGFKSTLIDSSLRQNLIERLSRRGLKMSRKYPVGAGMIVIRMFDGGLKVLVLKDAQGVFDLPKGKLDPGEELFNCAVRETSEEASIDEIRFPWGKECFKMENLTFYLCETDQDPVIRENPEHGFFEHESASWFDPLEAQKILPEYLKPAMEWAIHRLVY